MLASTEQLRFALDSVREASLLTRLIQTDCGGAALEKSDRSPVTVADFAAQAVVAGRLATCQPDWTLVAEEDSDLLASSPDVCQKVLEYLAPLFPGCTPNQLQEWIDRGKADGGGTFWTLDPVDGTKGFLRQDQYAVALALIEGGKPVLGVLGCPNLSLPGWGRAGALIAAVRGQGTWAFSLEGPESQRLSVSPCREPGEARVLKSYESAHTNFGEIARLVEELGAEPQTIAMDSQAKYGLLAAGGGELLFRIPNPKTPDYREKIWDHAAGALVVQEAGGRITDLDGRELDFSLGRTLEANRGVLASNGHLHQKALRALSGE